MLDINFIRENVEVVKKAAKDKGFDSSVIDQLLVVDKRRRELILEVDSLRAKINQISDSIEKLLDAARNQKVDYSEENIRSALKLLHDAEAKYEENSVLAALGITRDQSDNDPNAIKNQLNIKEGELKQSELVLRNLMLKVPNLNSPDVKVGTAEDNEVIKTVGEIPKFNFKVRDHVEIGQLTATIDLERGAKVAAGGYFYFKNELALLELALAQYSFEKLVKKGFIPVITPNVAKERNVVGCGFQARSDKERQIYHIEDEDLDLIATAEITLVGLHTDEIMQETDLPKKYVGYSSCYRKEIGSYGKDVRGILRVHEFKKIEMVVFCRPEDSEKIHEELLAIEEEVYQELGIPYQVIKMATGDLGNAAYKKFDLEAWMPSQEKYREVTSTSNTTDFQARRLGIRYKREGKNEYVHTLNGTITTTSRTTIAIMENFQEEDGSVRIPKVLQKWVGKEKIEVKQLLPLLT